MDLGQCITPSAASVDRWVCPVCGQHFAIEIFGCVLAPENMSKCRLRAHATGGECIAFRNPRRARGIVAVMNKEAAGLQA